MTWSFTVAVLCLQVLPCADVPATYWLRPPDPDVLADLAEGQGDSLIDISSSGEASGSSPHLGDGTDAAGALDSIIGELQPAASAVQSVDAFDDYLSSEVGRRRLRRRTVSNFPADSPQQQQPSSSWRFAYLGQSPSPPASHQQENVNVDSDSPLSARSAMSAPVAAPNGAALRRQWQQQRTGNQSSNHTLLNEAVAPGVETVAHRGIRQGADVRDAPRRKGPQFTAADWDAGSLQSPAAPRTAVPAAQSFAPPPAGRASSSIKSFKTLPSSRKGVDAAVPKVDEQKERLKAIVAETQACASLRQLAGIIKQQHAGMDAICITTVVQRAVKLMAPKAGPTDPRQLTNLSMQSVQSQDAPVLQQQVASPSAAGVPGCDHVVVPTDCDSVANSSGTEAVRNSNGNTAEPSAAKKLDSTSEEAAAAAAAPSLTAVVAAMAVVSEPVGRVEGPSYGAQHHQGLSLQPIPGAAAPATTSTTLTDSVGLPDSQTRCAGPTSDPVDTSAAAPSSSTPNRDVTTDVPTSLTSQQSSTGGPCPDDAEDMAGAEFRQRYLRPLLHQHVQRLDAVGTSLCLHSLAKLPQTDARIVAALAQRAAALAPSLTPRLISQVLLSCAKLQCWPEIKVVRKLLAQANRLWPAFNGQDLSNLLLALAKARYRPPSK